MTDKTANAITLLLVDDHPLVREGLIARMDSVADIRVVGEAGDAAEALERAAALKPQVVLTDIGMRGTDGIELTRQLLARDASVLVLVLSMFDKVEYAQRAMAVGARGYVLKDSPSDEIIGAIRTVAAGGTWLSPALARQIFRPAARRVQLSEREQQILSLIGQGQSSKQIARVLEISVRTVETHRQSLHRKLELGGQADLVRYAVEHARGQLPQR